MSDLKNEESIESMMGKKISGADGAESTYGEVLEKAGFEITYPTWTSGDWIKIKMPAVADGKAAFTKEYKLPLSDADKAFINNSMGNRFNPKSK
jgi:hypothetical protein